MSISSLQTVKACTWQAKSTLEYLHSRGELGMQWVLNPSVQEYKSLWSQESKYLLIKTITLIIMVLPHFKVANS